MRTSNSAKSVPGQNAKSSPRADVFRFASRLRRSLMRSAPPNPEAVTLPLKRQSSMRPGERRSRKANFESLDESGNTAHVHIKRVARTKYREPLRIRRAAD